MRTNLSAAIFVATCLAALTITLHVAAAQSLLPAHHSPVPAALPATYTEYRNDRWRFSIFVPDNFS